MWLVKCQCAIFFHAENRIMNFSETDTSIICTVVGYEVGKAESPSYAMVVSAMLRCDLVSTLYTFW